MSKIQNKKLSITNKFRIHDESIILIDILLGILCLIYNDLIFKDFYLSLFIAFIFMLLLFIVDIKIISKISANQRKDNLVDEMMDLVLIFRSSNSVESAIVIAFSKIHDSVYQEEDDIKEKLNLISNYFGSIKYDIFYKACMTNPKYECLTKVRNLLENKDVFLSKYLKINKDYKWAMAIFFLFEIGLSYFHAFYSAALLSGEGIILHLIMCTIFVLLYYCSSIHLSNQSKKNQVERFLEFFICYSTFEKPFIAYDDACLISNKVGEELLSIKESVVSGNIDDFHKYIQKYTKEEQRILLYIFESIKRNYLIKEIPIMKKGEDLFYKYTFRLFIILPLFSLISLFIIEVFYL